jgi:hypothetical protein
MAWREFYCFLHKKYTCRWQMPAAAQKKQPVLRFTQANNKPVKSNFINDKRKRGKAIYNHKANNNRKGKPGESRRRKANGSTAT